MSFRDSEFQESLQAFKISSSLATKDHVPDDQVSQNSLCVEWDHVADGEASENRYHPVCPQTPGVVNHVLTV